MFKALDMHEGHLLSMHKGDLPALESSECLHSTSALVHGLLTQAQGVPGLQSWQPLLASC